MIPSGPIPTRRTRSLALVGLLGAAMATATYLQGALSVLSSFVIEEFSLSRSQLGIAFTAFSLVGAFSSPVMGSLTDHGTRRVMVGLFSISGAAILVIAAAPGFPVLIVGSALGGIALGAGNPVTNRVVSERISQARRGLVVGLKQAGPPLGLLLAGVVLPPLAVAVGWRWALAVSSLIAVSGLAATPFLLSGSRAGTEAPATRMSEEGSETRSVVLWLTVIGLGVAMGLSGMIAFVPLYAQERVGASATTAGSLAASMGLAGVAGRIVWGAVSGRFSRPSTALIVISMISVGATVAVAAAETLGLALLWVGVIGTGLSMLAWHAVAWVVIIDRVGTGGVGKASGVMQVGNSAGFATGPPLVGAIVDATTSYTTAWAVVAGVFSMTALLTVWVRVRSRSQTGS